MKHYYGKNCVVELNKSDKSIAAVVQEKITLHEGEQRDEAFIIGDLGDIIKKYERWNAALPRVRPFYAVKCNDDHAVLKLLVDMGLSFDCASKVRRDREGTSLGVDPERIVYANPCKQTSFIKYAAKKHVSMMTFDNEDELHKIKAFYPDAQLILRILPQSNFKVQCELGNKFGCNPKKARYLLEAAKDLGLNVMGISFHVGSGCEEAEAFAVAVQQARDAFDAALQLGFDMTMLDIGGGFPGQSSAPISFEEIALVLNEALDRYFPDTNVDIIAEPGRYFVASAFTLGVNIIAKRIVARDQHGDNDEPLDYPTANDEPVMMYYVNDGVYGSFNCLLYDHATVQVSVPDDSDGDVTYTSSIWGPTCDGLDCILENTSLPELRVGNWLYFKDMGAYTMSAASTFNGMPPPRRFYNCSLETWHTVYPELSHKQRYIDSIPHMKAGRHLEETPDILATSPTDAFLFFGTSPKDAHLGLAYGVEN
ncbi:hypothetical protein FSP39_011674 [Pinctada imbricata]|uniref:ornithine decarboxylase n=1 Tax=Pinctada imbricata TaxID=66713 RepID=A0AA89C167_PINIB|nr:hypothetical protein FSP39_011674 [Pinctada imbricata]